jgi:hypothetical protein
MPAWVKIGIGLAIIVVVLAMARAIYLGSSGSFKGLGFEISTQGTATGASEQPRGNTTSTPQMRQSQEPQQIPTAKEAPGADITNLCKGPWSDRPLDCKL